MNKRPMCNICGVPESELKNGTCSHCGKCVCEITPDDLIDQRAYDYCTKFNLLDADKKFNIETLFSWLARSVYFYQNTPAYVLESLSHYCLSHPGYPKTIQYKALTDVPTEVVFRVLKSDTPTIRTGGLFWRAHKDACHPFRDGLNVIQAGARLEAGRCDEVLPRLILEKTTQDPHSLQLKQKRKED